MNAFTDRMKSFWECVAFINDQVGELCDTRTLEVEQLFWSVRTKLRRKWPGKEEELLDFAIDLLSIPPMPNQVELAEHDPKIDDFMAACHAVVPDKSFGIDRGEELLMENLTAAWLALYFLGVPFVQPWERVRRLANQRGGFPTGACVAKFAGDVYRVERQQIHAAQRVNQSMGGVRVLSYIPLPLIFKLMLAHPEEVNVTPQSVHDLGLRYVLLQMRIYIAEGHPISFLVPVEALWDLPRKLTSLKTEAATDLPVKTSRGRFWLGNLFWHRRIPNSSVEPGTDNPVHDPKTEVEDMWQTFSTLFGESAIKAEGQSFVILNEPEVTLAMPTCVLGSKTGIYTMETGNSGLHFAGNRIGDDLLKSYQTKLSGLWPKADGAGQSPPTADELLRRGTAVVLSGANHETFVAKINAVLEEGARKYEIRPS